MKAVLFRALFPRWNFFDSVSHRFSIEVKVGAEWRPLSRDVVRKPWSLLVNPTATLIHAEDSLISNFIARPSSEALGLIQNLVVSYAGDVPFRILATRFHEMTLVYESVS